MDWLLTAFQWVMMHQPAFPWSLIFAGVAFFLTVSFVKGIRERDEDWTFGPVILSVIVAIVAVMGGGMAGEVSDTAGKIIKSQSSYYWYHWISLVLGWVVMPAFLAMANWVIKRIVRAVKKGIRAVAHAWSVVAHRWTSWRQRTAAKAEAKRKAEEVSPEHVIAECRRIVEEFRATLPKDVGAPEAMRRAGDYLEAIEALYELDHELAVLTPGNDAVLAEKIRKADALFARVSLERECPELVATIRREHHSVDPVREHIAAAIEALYLRIMTLPDCAAGKLALQVPHEYQQVVDDLRQPDGTSLLPDLTAAVGEQPVPVPLAAAASPVLPKQIRRQTA